MLLSCVSYEDEVAEARKFSASAILTLSLSGGNKTQLQHRQKKKEKEKRSISPNGGEFRTNLLDCIDKNKKYIKISIYS